MINFIEHSRFINGGFFEFIFALLGKSFNPTYSIKSIISFHDSRQSFSYIIFLELCILFLASESSIKQSFLWQWRWWRLVLLPLWCYWLDSLDHNKEWIWLKRDFYGRYLSWFIIVRFYSPFSLIILGVGLSRDLVNRNTIRM